MVVSGFSPSGDFAILNNSPLGALIVDDLDAQNGEAEIIVRADG